MRIFSRLLLFLFFTLALLSAKDSQPQDLKKQDLKKQDQKSTDASVSTPGPDADPYAAGFKAGLAQHEKLLQEARDELGRVQKEVDSAKSNNEWFLTLYGILTAFLLGEGILSLQKQKSQSKEIQKEAHSAAKEATKAAGDAQESAENAKDVAAKAGVEIDKILKARQALFSELPVYLEETIQASSALNPDTFDVFHKVLVNEVDHLTFFGSSFRFREPESPEEMRAYCDSLLVTVRGHLVQGRPAESLKRIEMFFKLIRSGKEVKDEDASRMYGYRASAYMELLRAVESEAALKKPQTLEKARKYRKEVTASLENAKNLSANWSGAHFYEAYFYSLFPVPPDISDPQERARIYLAGQQRAISLYRSLIHDYAKLSPNMVGAARLNICCCLKRLADDSGNYDKLFAELQGFPSESEIRDHNLHDSRNIDQSSEDLWSSLMQDDVFFQEGPAKGMSKKDYKAGWVNVLDSKANLLPWRDRYSYYASTTSSLSAWKVKAWEP